MTSIDIKRDFDAVRINRVVNDPSVFPHVALPGQTELDLSPITSDMRNVVLMMDDGGMVCHQLEPGIYEVHMQFLPPARGKTGLRFTNAAIHWMFTKTDCMELLTKVPVNNLAAEGLVQAIHGTLEFTRKKAWPQHDGEAVDVKYYSLHYHSWVRHANGLIERGEWFHKKVDEADTTHEPHDNDPAHSRHVGATVDMILAGQVDKGIILYNRWARFAGYLPVMLLSRDPLIIDIVDALIIVKENDFIALPHPNKARK